MDQMLSKNGFFGIELEFFLLDEDLQPALNASYSILDAWKKGGNGAPLCHELASFQLELNPGPWPLSLAGIDAALNQLEDMVAALRRVSTTCGFLLDLSGFVPNLSSAILESPDFFTRSPRYLASSTYFCSRSATLRWRDGRTLRLNGERVVGCINEIHIHIQQRSDTETLAFFNRLNQLGHRICTNFERTIEVNGSPLADDCTTTTLFTEANGEWNADGSVCRVGFIPYEVQSFAQYEEIVHGFAPVGVDGGSFLDPFSTVYFWARLRGSPGHLRVEFRPMEMGEDWSRRVRFLADLGLEFQSTFSRVHSWEARATSEHR